jgi:tRNA dimethylallyltransferase
MIVIVGATASGKTAVGLKLAKKINGEIVSADSRQIYKYLDIGTAKPEGKWNGSGQYVVSGIAHHLVDFLDPDETFSAGSYVKLARKILKDIKKSKHNPIAVGGTGLYINALVDGITELPERNESIRKKLNRLADKHGAEYLHNMLSEVDPQTAGALHKHNLQRIIRALEVYEITGIPVSKLHRTKGRGVSSGVKNAIFFGVSRPRDILYKRIEKRVDEMLDRGMIEETKDLLESGYSPKSPALQSLGYKHITKYLNNNIQYDLMRQLIIRDTRHYAKRQLTWFRRDTRINWINCEKTRENKIIDFIVNKWKKSLQ